MYNILHIPTGAFFSHSGSEYLSTISGKRSCIPIVYFIDFFIGEDAVDFRCKLTAIYRLRQLLKSKDKYQLRVDNILITKTPMIEEFEVVKVR